MTENNYGHDLTNEMTAVNDKNAEEKDKKVSKDTHRTKHKTSHAVIERPNRKSVPTLETIEMSNEPIVLRKPTLIMTAPSMDDPRMEEEMFEEGTICERPTEFEPRIRRVSDVIDSSGDGNSLPSSPRLTTFSEQISVPGTPPSVTAFLPDWLSKTPRKQINSSTDSASINRMPAPDRTDAAPMNSEPCPDEDEYENGPHDVVAYMPVEKDSHEYNMSHKRRGRAIIFNHDEFEVAGYSSRPGSDVDAKNLEMTFVSLHFEVTIYNNLEYASIMAVINNLKAEDHSDADCIMIAVLSHGMNGGYVLSKDVPYSVEKLWLAFKPDVCPTLAGKPKLFFIQACRGEKLDAGVHMMRKTSRTQTDSAASDYKIPTFADFLIAFSTVDGHYAWRNPETGTWFVQCLCQELRDSGTTVDLLKLMTRAARRVALDHQSYNDVLPWQHEMKQVPSITTMLIRDVFFRPKVAAAMEIEGVV